jgi:hypothetical protein
MILQGSSFERSEQSDTSFTMIGSCGIFNRNVYGLNRQVKTRKKQNLISCLCIMEPIQLKSLNY